MESCFKYFDVLKNNLHTDAQIIIAYHWRKVLKARAAAKVATKGKKGKKGKGKKKAEPEKTPTKSRQSQ